VSINAETLTAGGPGTPARPLVVSRARTSRRLRLDRLASRTVVVGGIVIISAILAILLVIAAEVWPLFRGPRAELAGRFPTPGAVRPAPGASLGVDEYRETASIVTSSGALALVPLTAGGSIVTAKAIAGLEGARVTTVAAYGRDQYAVGTSDGRAIPLEVKFDVSFDGGRRALTVTPVHGVPTTLDGQRKRAVLRLAAAAPDAGPVTVGQVGPRELVVQTVVEKKALIGGTRREEALQTLTAEVDGAITALHLDARGDDLLLGTSTGQIVRYDLRDRGTPRAAETVTVGTAPITALSSLLGDRTFVAGDHAGAVSSWQVIPPPTGGAARLTRINVFEAHAAPVVAISASRRDKGFVTADTTGRVKLHYGTSGQTLLTFDAGTGLRGVVFAPKANGVVAVDERAGVIEWRIDNPHPEITLKTLFGKVWYEGYSRPEWVWQSTGGTDDFESKLSLTPLVYGTLKGTFYALVFAVPLSILAALYVSEFMHPAVKSYVKPVVEIMAALPSVVLGFLAGLWLAPIVERIVPGLFLMPLVAPLAILTALGLWRRLPASVRGRVRPGSEVFVLVPVVVIAAWVAFTLGGVVEQRLLGGDYRGWLLSALGLTYDQRNALVVGVAMGFAVVPIIFTIAEDSLANVPQHLRAGSLALGANRWQTAVRIVLPTASPGIFSAIMIGLGRAVGETMIVLMATGNTPIMDASVFSGFRTLSANIAVELPEAPEGGTLFRVLFLAAFLLFSLTFALNSAAEMIRLRLRRRYRYL
jgi:phosphate transport system permease protein